MKRILLMLFACLLFIPCLVFADMSAPGVVEYKVSVNNPKGAIIYENNDGKYVKTDKKLEFGTIIKIEWEEDKDWIYLDSEMYPGDETGYVSYKDVTTLVKNYIPNEKELSDEYPSLVLKDVVIKKGPALGYEETGVTIKAGTKVSIKHFLRFEEDGQRSYIDGMNPWVYVEYNGTKGFINSYDGTLAMDETYTTAIASIDIELKDVFTGEKTTIKANEKVNVTVWNLDDWSSCYLIKYNNISGIINDDRIFIKDANVWINEEGKEEGREFELDKDYYVYDIFDVDDFYDNYDSKELPKSKKIGVAPAGTKFSSDYSIWFNEGYCVRYENGDTKGWILVVDENAEYSEEDNIDISEPSVVDKKDPTVVKKDKYQIIYFTIAGALLVALTAFVTIVFVNKKNKKEINDNSNNEKV